MDAPSIQPSFIPKGQTMSGAPMRAREKTGIFTIITGFIFVLVLAGYGGTWFYKGHLIASNEEKKTQIEEEIKSFDTDLTRELTDLKLRLDSGERLLQSHTALSNFFTLLESITAQTVRFSSFDFKIDSGKYIVTMKGESLTYTAAAFQSDVFAKNPYLISPIFSNLNIDDKGVISFDVKTEVDPKIISYMELVKKNSPATPAVVPPTASSTASTTTP